MFKGNCYNTANVLQKNTFSGYKYGVYVWAYPTNSTPTIGNIGTTTSPSCNSWLNSGTFYDLYANNCSTTAIAPTFTVSSSNTYNPAINGYTAGVAMTIASTASSCTSLFNYCLLSIPIGGFCGAPIKGSEEETDLNIDPTEENTIRIYPNPAQEFINVELSLPNVFSNVYIQFYNINGSKVLNEQLTSEKQIIKISELRAGIYLYKIYTEDEVLKTDKLVINR